MRMSSSDQKSFQRFTNYVKINLPQVANVPVIVRNMKKFGSLSEPEFRRALAWGNDPLIVVNTGPLIGPTGKEGDGLFEHSAPSQINILTGRVQDFNENPGTATDLNARGQPVIIVGVVLLHELVHWGNFNHGVIETTEQGEEFVKATYGRLIPFFSRVSPTVISP
jgi:hypothetical protein